MDTKMFNLVLNKTPKFNERIAKGYATEAMLHAADYISRIWRSTAESFPENLIYDDYTRCTPEEEANRLVKRLSNNQIFDLSPTDGYMVKYKLVYRDKERGTENSHYAYFRLPFLGQGGKTRIRGSVWTISPVLVDPIFSPTANGLFQSMVKSNENYYRLSYHFIADGVLKTATVVWAKLHHKKEKPKTGRRDRKTKRGRIPTPHSTLIHYMFSKFGATETFARLGADVKFGYPGDFDDLGEDWIICTSNGIKPTTAAKGIPYVPSKVQLAIKSRDLSSSNRILCALGSFFYIADHYPERLKSEYVDETRQWRILLGLTIFGEDEAGEGALVDKIERHLLSLDQSLDTVFKSTLEQGGIIVDTIYDLFIHIIETIQQRLIVADPTTMYGKKLMVLEYVLDDIVHAITHFMFELQRIDKPVVSEQDVVKAMKRWLKDDAFYRKATFKHSEINMVATPCDSMVFEHTTKVTQQTSSNSAGYGTGMSDPSKLLHASIAEVGSYGNQPKSEPTGRSVLNPYLNISKKGEVLRSETFKPLLDEIQGKIRRR